ncbi:HAD hydrolase, family IA, variant 1 [Sphingobacterium spiritivorum ATCC 33300]|uniref:HAD hydrolase, family IA, variant 1 n=1 Tax=Sphingobacterium spiritivorum ATCC 33300 TaxID=525372 RepID=C2FVR4_SPHSI|nr:HAD family hydrolase [Sphingobacterium spiritivorum]EEI92906.1 HAD hydrolase, family IA, variant 1 [Sphingobacterium spiritivorum ATCC 33300]QQS96261.1 HAD family hydrolase [Sphingobacterium spiritivorum]
MKQYRNLLFDLDGTLTDPFEGITKSIAYALEHFDIETTDLNTLKPLIGPPLKQSLIEIYHFDEQKADEGVAKYRERFADKGLFENILFEGIPELLASARSKGYKLYLATSKPTVFATQILNHFHLDQYFEFVGGSELDDSRPTKTHVIEYVLQENNIQNLTETLMIGDRKHDIIGAKNTGLDSVGVLYGFGDQEELSHAGATYIAEDIPALKNMLQL